MFKTLNNLFEPTLPMNSGGQQDANIEKQETSAMAKFQAVEFTLTQDQYTIIQHFLPKGYTLQ